MELVIPLTGFWTNFDLLFGSPGRISFSEFWLRESFFKFTHQNFFHQVQKLDMILAILYSQSIGFELPNYFIQQRQCSWDILNSRNIHIRWKKQLTKIHVQQPILNEIISTTGKTQAQTFLATNLNICLVHQLDPWFYLKQSYYNCFSIEDVSELELPQCLGNFIQNLLLTRFLFNFSSLSEFPKLVKWKKVKVEKNEKNIIDFHLWCLIVCFLCSYLATSACFL